MLRTIHPRLAALGDNAGFTLIELLVGMLSAIVVTGALFAILIVSLHQTARISGHVQATQLGRITMARMVDELHTACIAKEFTPIQEKSNENVLIFESGYGQEAVLKKAYKHKIVFSSSESTLVETTYASNGGEWPNFTYETTGKATRIGEYISKSGTTPIFQYYKYAPSSSSTSAVTTLEPLAAAEAKEEKGLSATNAKQAAAVLVTYTAGAAEAKQYKPTIDLSSQVTFAFSAPSAETPIVAKPCE
jgi:Tfp pilus assembly protein PilW